ncbi:hypothetical protein [Microbacterium sp.]|uniref:hypothetical protein n=1 Tax=Microbacterium sp. TaxID=51671 RepID=UPI002FE34E1C
MSDTGDEQHESPAGVPRAELERRLEEVRMELESVSRDRLRWPTGSAFSLQDRSEKLETEADAIRKQLGLPAALGRPPREHWSGYLVLCIAIVAIVVGVIVLIPR